jgi:hypothetical protein
MVELGCAQRTNLEKTASSEGVGEARPEEILLWISYRIVNAQRREKLKAVSFQAVSKIHPAHTARNGAELVDSN